MHRAKRLYLLLGVLVVVCVAAFAALHLEQRQEQIQNSGETVLEIDPDSVQSLSWTYEGETLSFHRDETWLYDDDEAFPVDEEAITQLLEQFQAFSAAFIITDVEDYAQYGLDDPLCTIDLTAGEDSYQILLGDYSTMDSQRYVSFGDGNVYLAVSDPLDVYDTDLSGLILNDEVPALDQVTQVTFSGAADYAFSYEENSGASYLADDVYFTQQDGTLRPLDTDRVEDYLSDLEGLDLSDYVTYNVTDEEPASYGLDQPELTVTVDYTAEDENGTSSSHTFILHLSQDPEQRTAQEADSQTDEDTDSQENEEEITAYARVGDSQIVYQIPSDDYTALMAGSYNDLRHQAVFWGNFEDITQLDISLEGTLYTITAQGDGDDRTYTCQEEELDLADLQDALEALEAAEFTDEAPDQQEEISLTLYLDQEAFPQVQIQLYRYDGTNCLAVVDGEPVSLVPRSQVVALTEAVRALVWD